MSASLAAPVPSAAAPPRAPARDLTADLTWRGLRRLFGGHPVLPLAPERGIRPAGRPEGSGPVLASAGSAAAMRHLAEAAAGEIAALALHLPPGGDAAAAAAVAGRIVAEGGRAVLLHEAPEAPKVVAGVATRRIPNLGLIAGTPPGPVLSDAPAERPASPSRPLVLVALHDPVAASARPHPRDLAWRDLFRWDVARWLDRLAPRTALHWIPLRTGFRQDDNVANLEVAMRMRHYGASRLEHAPPEPLDALQALAQGARLVVTTEPLLAGFALGCRAMAALLPVDPAAAAAFGEGEGAAPFAPLLLDPFALGTPQGAARAAATLSDAALRRSVMGARDAALRDLPALRADILSTLEG